jgi:hypothetical protein
LPTSSRRVGCTNAKRHPDYLPGSDFRTSALAIGEKGEFVKVKPDGVVGQFE